MRIIQLVAENIKRLSAVQITPEGAIVQVTGKNGSGKSSVLDSIWWALAGQSNIQAMPIRKGAEHGKIKLSLGENEPELIVTRTFTENGSQLSVVSEQHGQAVKYSSPQAVLDKLCSALAFDPLGFTRQDARKQFETLRKIVKLSVDIEALDKANKADYDRRHDLNKRKNDLDARIEAFPEFPADLPASPLDSAYISQQVAAAHEKNASIDLETARRKDSLDRAIKNEQKATLRIRELESLLDTAKADHERFKAQIRELQSVVPEPKTDTSALTVQLQSVERTNKLIEQKAEKLKLCEESRQLFLNADLLTTAMETRTAEKQKAIASARMPVKGLSFGDGIVLYKGVPIEQASSAEQLRVSCAIGMAGNPKLRVMIIKDGSLLDSDSLKLLSKMADEQDWQIWLERVDASGQVGIVMEDGHVKEQEK